jgi:L-serine/L-threonine ammonia-lyase
MAQSDKVIAYVCSDSQAMLGSCDFLDEYRIVTEAACGAALSVLKSPLIEDAASVVFIVCGGAAMSAENLLNWGVK